MNAKCLVGALLVCAVLSNEVAIAGFEDGPLPPGVKITILDIKNGNIDSFANGRVESFGNGRVENFGSDKQGLGGAPASIGGSTVQELASAGSGITAKETQQSIVIGMQADLLFDFDRADLRPTAVATLQRISQFIAAKAKKGVLIEGHTDAKGSVPYNQKLSLARADSVRRWLVERGGLSSVSFTTSGLGASKPVAPNVTADGRDDPAGRQQNRRVAIIIGK